MADLPILPENFELEPRDAKSKKQLDADRQADEARRRRPDRERLRRRARGRADLRVLYELAGVDEAGRAALDLVDDEGGDPPGLRAAAARRRAGALEAAARSRSEADWLVGMNATRAATHPRPRGFGSVVSLGRVQTPTLAMMVRREREIQAFEPGAVLARRRDVPARATPGRVEGDETRIFGDAETRADAIVGEGARQGGRRHLALAHAALATAAPLRPHGAAARGTVARLHRARTLQAAQGCYEKRRSRIRARLAATSRATWSRSSSRPPGTLRPLQEYAQARSLRADLPELPLGPRRQQREGQRPPRDHPDRRRARHLGPHARRAPHLRPGRAALPRRLPPAARSRARR